MYKISYTGDGARTEFEFSFPFFQNADVRVALDEVMQVMGTDFSVVPNAHFDGGVVVFSSAPADGVRIDILRRIALTRVIDYQPTHEILPEHLNTDFNFLLEALRDMNSVEIDLAQWQNTHDNVVNYLEYTKSLIQDKLSAGAMGIYNNLLTVLADLINDNGSVTDPAPAENHDDYGLL